MVDFNLFEEGRRHRVQFDKASRGGGAVFLRHEQRPEWKASMPLYVRWCDSCRVYSITYPAGYGRIRCRGCRHDIRVMTWQRLRDKHLRPTLRLVLGVMLATVIMLFLIQAGYR